MRINGDLDGMAFWDFSCLFARFARLFRCQHFAYNSKESTTFSRLFLRRTLRGGFYEEAHFGRRSNQRSREKGINDELLTSIRKPL